MKGMNNVQVYANITNTNPKVVMEQCNVYSTGVHEWETKNDNKSIN